MIINRKMYDYIKANNDTSIASKHINMIDQHKLVLISQPMSHSIYEAK